ncbi:MAG: RNA polymerase sigma factor [Mycobacteriales bacterium]
MSDRNTHDRIQAVVEANIAYLLAYFYRRAEEAEDAADLLSDTLLVVWRKASDLPLDDTEARMWMFGVARRVLSTHRRATGRRSALHDKLRDELATTTQEHSSDGVDVAAAVRLLAPGDQELASRLIFWGNYSADFCGLSGVAC